MALSTGKKFAIGVTGCLAVAMAGPVQSTTTATGEVESFSNFTYGGSPCNVFNTRIDLKDASSGQIVKLDATDWARETCNDKNAPELKQGVQFEVKYKELLLNRLIHFTQPSVQSIAVAKPAA